jgi:hypothetical protein
MKRYVPLILSLVFLTGCGSNASKDFNAAGCVEVNGVRYDLAAQQFALAAENGDPGAIRAADNSKRVWYLMTYTPANETYEQFQARLDELDSLEKRMKSYCNK